MRRRDFCKLASSLPLALHERALHAQNLQAGLRAHDAQVRQLLARMSLAEKLGQMAQGELGNLADEADVEDLFLGSVLSGGGADPAQGNSLQAWTAAVEGLIERSRRTRLGIPILYGADAVHGHNNVLGATVFPHNIGLGCSRNPALVEECARITALEVRASAIQWTFAPCVAVPRDDRWGRSYEGFAEEPGLVAELGAAAVRGLQHGGLGNPRAVLACAKHYVGDGATVWGSTRGRGGAPGMDQGNARVSEEELRRVHLPGYIAAIEAGAGSIMASYNSWQGVKVTGIRYLMTEVLKEELGFEGFVISDYYAIGQLDSDYKRAVELAINAGIDMAMEPAGYRRFIETLGGLVDEGRVEMARIDDAVTRILRVKAAMGLLDASPRLRAEPELAGVFGGAAHRAVARRAVRESLVLLQNRDGVLPLSRQAGRIHVAGGGADDIGMQCGGWTVEWQGARGAVTNGTSILEALRYAAPRSEISYSADGEGAEGADACVVVAGEEPYAEGVGDSAEPALSAEDRALIARIAAGGTPVVLLLLSGRPLVLGDALEDCAAIVAAWLPGSEGQGVADVLFGDHAPSGRLAFSWPRDASQHPLNIGEEGYDPLFAYGFGLNYS